MPSAQPLWHSFKTATGYDAANSRSILHHALHAWYFWHECSSAKSHSQFCASASGVARRALRGWRRWMLRTRLFAPSWQRYRIWPRQLPPLPARKPPARLEPRPVLSHLAYGRKFWRGKSGSQRELALEARWHDPKELQRLRLREEWEPAHLASLQEPYKLAPGRPWLRSWQSSTAPAALWQTRFCGGKTILIRYCQWQELRPKGFPTSKHSKIPSPGAQRYTFRGGRPPPKARFVLCHYGQPHSWHEVAATVTANEVSWTQWQEVVLNTTVGSCQGSPKWAGIQPTLAMLRTQLAVFNTSRRRVYRRHPQSHQRSWQPPRHPTGPHGIQPVPSRPSQPSRPTRPLSRVAGFPGFGTHATNLAALDCLIEQAAARIQRAFRHFSRQRSSCLGSTVARPQSLSVCNQPEEEGKPDSEVASSGADTEASQASTLLACLLLACQAFAHSRYRRHPRRSASIASESWAWSTSRFWAPRPTADSRLPHCPTASRVGCTYRRRRLGLHRGCTDGTGFRLSLEP